MDKKFKVAIAGLGRWGSSLIYEFSKQSEIGYLLYKNSEKTRKFIEENHPSIPATQSLEEILADKTINAMIIATPTDTHFEIALKSLNANKHVFLEKPGGTKSSELEKLCKVAEENNLKLAIGYKFVHHPVLKKIIEVINIKDIKSIFFEWNKWGTFEDHSVSNLLSHEISILNAIGFDSLSVKNYFQQAIISNSDIVDITFENEKQIPITCHINRVSKIKYKRITFVGSSENYIWSDNNLYLINGTSYSMMRVEQTTAVTEEIKDFFKCISENTNPLVDGRFALKVFKIVNQILNDFSISHPKL